jgi:hypothetical protein
MYNLQSSYNRFISYRINELEDKLSKLNPRTRRGKEAQLKLDTYQNKVKPNSEHHFQTQNMLCFVVCALHLMTNINLYTNSTVF